MRKFMRFCRWWNVIWVTVCLLAPFPRNGWSQSQVLQAFPPGVFQNRAAINGAAATYQGPGDVFTTSPYAAYSCTEAFTAAYATSLGNACDLVDSAAPTVVICTLKFAATGRVDLSAYCPGSVTPAAKCAAATGAVCNISQAYDQTGNARHVVGSVAANQPTLTFSSSPTGTLPVINCGSGATILMQTAGTVTQAQPLTMSAVLIRNSGTAEGSFGSSTAGQALIGSGNGANQAEVAGGSFLGKAATDNQWYSLQGLLNGNGTASAINVNGSDTTGAAGTVGFSAANIRLCRAGAHQLLGLLAEYHIWAATSTSTDRNNISTNQHSAGRYNF